MRPRNAFRNVAAGFTLLVATFFWPVVAVGAPPEIEAGRVIAAQDGGNFSLGNQVVGAKWSVTHGEVNGLVVMDRLHGTDLRVAVPFAILLQDGTIFGPDNLKLAGQAVRRELTPRPEASRLADRLHGEEFDFPMESSDHSLHVTWSLKLLDGSSYLRQLLTISAVGRDLPIRRVRLIDLPLPEIGRAHV